MYTVVSSFMERFDQNHIYNKGELYPREGFSPTKERIAELVEGTNRLNQVFLKVLKSEKEDTLPEATAQPETGTKSKSKNKE